MLLKWKTGLIWDIVPVLLSVCCCFAVETNLHSINKDETEAEAVRQLLQRLLPEKVDHFEINVGFNLTGKDFFQISRSGDKVLIEGNRGYSVAAGLHHYLKYLCGGHVSWSGRRIPNILPLPTQSIKITFHDRYRYYQNVCTSSYSFVWWNWERWEKEIDWMALNGINLALAFTAQEYILYKVFESLNFTDNEIGVFFTGPAFLAWNRMGNLQGWGGSLSQNWHQHQVTLQRQIINRMRSFGIQTVLPAFSGRVVPAFKKNFPNADTTVLNKTWGKFQEPFTFVTFLQPSDPLFQTIGAEFLRKYTEEFGTDHFYSADLFNEMPPPSSEPSYLQSCAKNMYRSLTTVDSEAVWIMQGWMFYSDSDIWKTKQARAFLQGVPIGKMIVLDLQSELYPQYLRLQNYFGHSFIWCMLHNYGGVVGLYGSMESINQGPFAARSAAGSTMIGVGITPEGIETNDIVYELMNEMAWRKTPVTFQKWLRDYAIRRYGNDSHQLFLALSYLKRSVYEANVPYRNHGKYILVKRPSLKLKPYLWYEPNDVFNAWRLFLNVSDSSIVQSNLYRHDLVDLTRQALQLVMDFVYPSLVNAFRSRNFTAFDIEAEAILELYDDMDELLASDEHFLLGRWLLSAIKLAKTPLEKIQYQFNARNQITLWGPAGELVDYANKQWAGLMSQYYRKRWLFFTYTLKNCIKNKKGFKQSVFDKAVFREVENVFNLGREIYDNEPKGDPIQISRKLYEKYGLMLSNTLPHSNQ